MSKIVRYIGNGHFDGLTQGMMYKAISEDTEQYVIYPNDLGAKSTISKEKFSANVLDLGEPSVDTGSDCLVYVSHNWVPAKFIGVFQKSKILDASPMIGGHAGGIMHFPVAVVKINGELVEVAIGHVKFIKH